MVKWVSFSLLALTAFTASAQVYDFSIPEFSCKVEVLRDRSLEIEYDILFQCTPGFSSVDIVDIGFPSGDFRLDEIEAWIDGDPARRIYISSYIDDGVEVHLEGNAIDPGETGRFALQGNCRDMVFLDTEDDDYASMEFTPTWFDGDLLTGYSSFTLSVIFPEGSEPASVRHHDRPFTSSRLEDGRVVYEWTETRKVDGSYTVGISFPDSRVEGPLTERPREPLLSREAKVKIAVFGVFFLFFGLVGFVFIRSIIQAHRRKEQYLPPKLGLEGTGIKRGLTAPMAALLLEEKLERVLQLMIFGLLKKGCLQVEDGRLIKTGSIEGLRSYEKTLMDLIPDGTLGAYRTMFTDMIEDLEKKMEGFSLEDTRRYYRSIIQDAWRMVVADGSAERAGRILGDRMQWLLVDENFHARVRQLPEERSVVLPAFIYGVFTGRLSIPVGPGGMSLSQACSQLAGALETTAANAVSGLSSMSAAVTSVTNPVPVYASSGSSGSGCACACACAGCACACAGGGR